MKKALLVSMTIICFGMSACASGSEGADVISCNIGFEEEFDSSAGVESVLENAGGNIESVEESQQTGNSQDESVMANSEPEETKIVWKDEKAELSIDCLYRISEDETIMIAYQEAGYVEMNGLSILNPPQYQYLTIVAEQNVIQLDGNHIEPMAAYLVKQDGAQFLLLATNEAYDFEERLWLFQLEDGKVTQCGEPIDARLISFESVDAIEAQEVVNVATTMSWEEYSSTPSDFVYQRQFYQISNGELKTVPQTAEEKAIETDLHTYIATRFRNDETGELIRWEIKVYNGDALLQTIRYGHDTNVTSVPDWDELIWEEDVNFDGVIDIMILQGYYGTQGSKSYRCYYLREKWPIYWEELTFMDIPNPKVDTERQWICGQNRESESSYMDIFYQYDGKDFKLVQKDFYVWNETGNQYLQVYSLDASVKVYTKTDYALVGTYKSTSSREYSFSIYTSGDGIGECVDIGNISFRLASETEAWEKPEVLYKINEGEYCVFDYDASAAYYLFAQLQNDVWTIQIKDRDGNVLDTLTQTSHYEY